MFGGNPMYNVVPGANSGLEGMRSLFGGLIAQGTGGFVRPYVPPNQSVTDAYFAQYVNSPLSMSAMSHMYGQFGGQIGNTLGRTQLAQAMARMTGYSPARIQAELSSFGYDLGRSSIGSFLMPVADAFLTSAGISGGSFLGSMNTVLSSRMNLLSPGTLINPYNAGQQYQAMAGASAMMSLLNGIISQKRDGKLMLTPDMAFTQGFDRQTIAQLAMQIAGAGGFNGAGGGFTDRLSAAAGGFNITNLNYLSGDFTGGGAKSNLTSKDAAQVKKIADSVREQIGARIETLSALRDLTKEIDGGIEKLTALTNGGWLRSMGGARSATQALRRLSATAQIYNLDPKAVMQTVMANRGLLQEAAGFDDVMQYYGFDGGGMFGLEAQGAIVENTAAMVYARGLQGDPVAAQRLQRQAAQAMARNMNTRAGVAAQALAYGRQLGIISEADADNFRKGLISGDRSVMEDTINRLLTTEFGSAKRGRELLNDQMFVNAMQQRMTGEAGRYATDIITRGADREWLRQEQMTTAANRMAFSKEVLAGFGLRTKQSDADVDRIVGSITSMLSEDPDGKRYSGAFFEQYSARVAGGMSRNAALQATVNSFKSNSATAPFTERITATMNRQIADNNEATLQQIGLPSGQAKAVADAMRSANVITSRQHSALMKLIRSGNGAQALAQVDSILSGLSPDQQALFGDVRANAAKSYESALQAIGDKREAARLVEIAGRSSFGSSAIIDSFNQTIGAAQEYLRSEKTDKDYDVFIGAVQNSKYGQIFGEQALGQLLESVKGPNARAFLEGMGRQSVQLQQMAVSVLKRSGYGLNYSGYWGEGRYAGNDSALSQKRREIVDKVVGRLADDSRKGAAGRSTVGQDFVDWITGDKNWKEMLRVYDKGGLLTGEHGITAEYGVAFDKYVKAMDAYGKVEKGYSDAVWNLLRGGKQDAVEGLKGIFDKAGDYTEENLKAFMSSNGISGKSAEMLAKAFKARKSVVSTKAAADKALIGMTDKEGFSDAVYAAVYNKAYAEADKKRYAKTSEFIDNLDTRKAGSWSGSLMDAYTATISAVTDQDVSDSFNGISLGKLNNPAMVARRRLDLLKEKASSGDAKAIAALDKFDVAREEANTTKIRGEITLKIGNESYPGVLEGNFGGIS